MYTELGARIKSLRKTRQLTQEQIADRLQISRQRYARLESGRIRITLDLLTRIAEIMDVTVRDITTVLEEMPSVSYRTVHQDVTSAEVFDILDFFYANRHLRNRMEQSSDQ